MPLVHGRYPVYNPSQVAAGWQAGTTQAGSPFRSNLELPAFFGQGAQVDTASLGGTTTGVYVSTICPVDVGAKYTTISILIGATAASTPTHGYAALYSGTAVAAPPLIVQSVDQTTAAMAASARFDYTLATPTVITPAMAPHGYVNVAIVCTSATTVPSCVTVPVNAIAATGLCMVHRHTEGSISGADSHCGRRHRPCDTGQHGHIDRRTDCLPVIGEP
jgi:hypothetical protein